ncbi:hypothetical protein BZG36_02508 [Bifiguratus adelaidae]|uniref:UBA domain-containing protein n=1 Tax=Bifiguratus adelaidae TaxID=1938954 RepID=A0A261Y2Q4_9FUNG|nr:hypothetical protein BZG36_02508 [Bifiguratus adelaidae]
MVLEVTNPNNVKIYTVSGGLGSRAIPDWLARRKRKALKRDLDYRTRIELIQDFEFPEASNRIKLTRDGKFAIATGVYKPQMRVFEFSEMSMKFDRHTDAENVNFEILSDDWTKTVLLQNDRSIEFHAQGGIHYRTRIPKFGRDLAYHFPTCDLLVVGASEEVYRLNLDQGRFLKPLVTESTAGINTCDINPLHQLFSFGTSSGTVEFWDPRSRSRVGLLTPQVASFDYPIGEGIEITAFKYREDGLNFAVGTSTGHTLLYDLRSSQPTLIKDHQYGFPIKSLHFHEGATDEGYGKVIAADRKIIKIWDRLNGKHFTSVEPPTDINDVCPVGNSGLLFTANEGIQMGSYYIPQLGPAPRWASFLENLTEEMEENPQSNVYDDYKFVTRKELAALNMEHLIGSNVLKAYMHGFFVDLRLYEKAKLIANPFAYEDYKKRVVHEKLEKERESRIRSKAKLPKVNRNLAKQLLDEKEAGNKKKSNDAAKVLEDSRFADMFADPDFEVDETAQEYKLLHPISKTKSTSSVQEEQEEEERDMERDERSDSEASDASDTSGSDSEDDAVESIRRSRGMTKASKPKPTQLRTSGPKKRRVAMMSESSTKDDSRSKVSKKMFADRLKTLPASNHDRIARTGMGGMEMTFKPKRKGAKPQGAESDASRRERRMEDIPVIAPILYRLPKPVSAPEYLAVIPDDVGHLQVYNFALEQHLLEDIAKARAEEQAKADALAARKQAYEARQVAQQKAKARKIAPGFLDTDQRLLTPQPANAATRALSESDKDVEEGAESDKRDDVGTESEDELKTTKGVASPKQAKTSLDYLEFEQGLPPPDPWDHPASTMEDLEEVFLGRGRTHPTPQSTQSPQQSPNTLPTQPPARASYDGYNQHTYPPSPVKTSFHPPRGDSSPRYSMHSPPQYYSPSVPTTYTRPYPSPESRSRPSSAEPPPQRPPKNVESPLSQSQDRHPSPTSVDTQTSPPPPPPPAPPLPHQPDPVQVAELINMGFTKQQAVEALQRNEFDVERAINFLLDST